MSHRSGWTQRGRVSRHIADGAGLHFTHSSPFISWVMVFMCMFAQTTCLVSFVPVTKQALVPPWRTRPAPSVMAPLFGHHTPTGRLVCGVYVCVSVSVSVCVRGEVQGKSSKTGRCDIFK